MPRILFIGHDASRSGAPFVLLHLIRWLKQNKPGYDFELLLLADGELEDEYRKVCEVHILRRQFTGPGIWPFLSKVARFLNKKLGSERRLISRLAATHHVVLGNTAVTLERLTEFKTLGNKTICWMHELDHALDQFFPREVFLQMAESIDGFIVGSKAVREMLVRRQVTRPVDVVYEFIDSPALPCSTGVNIRASFGVPADAFVVGACATIEWRKGVDLFVQIAERVLNRSTNTYFLWAGGRYAGTEAMYREIRSEIVDLGIGDRVIFADIRHDLSEYYRAMDIFLLASREDTFPLVCLEAASLEKPILCFQDAGGMPEFVEGDAGFAVPFLDLDTMGQKIELLRDDLDLRERMGKAAAAKVRDRHDVSTGAREILNIIDQVSAN